MENKEKVKEAKVRALGLFAKDKYACSEAILYAINAVLGNPLPAEIVRLASGFTGGIGKCGSICGALTGGVMALGLAFGRTEPGAGCSRLLAATGELFGWFEQTYGSGFCAVLTGKERPLDDKEDDLCSVITGETAAKAMGLILKYKNMSTGRVLMQRVRQTF
ncbi:MAG: C-GCAxxG-C-C family protein [Nitrospirota bacterium]|nr:C-GCAxxG-C-C family protein [Nitrospirota bacterium]